MAAMLDGMSNTIFLLWEMKSIFMQKTFIVPAIQYGCHGNPLCCKDYRWSASIGAKSNAGFDQLKVGKVQLMF